MSAGIKIYRDGLPIFDTDSGAVRILGMWTYGQMLLHKVDKLIKIPLPDLGGGEIFAMFVNSKERWGSTSNSDHSSNYYYVENGYFISSIPNENDRLILGVYYDRTS